MVILPSTPLTTLAKQQLLQRRGAPHICSDTPDDEAFINLTSSFTNNSSDTKEEAAMTLLDVVMENV